MKASINKFNSLCDEEKKLLLQIEGVFLDHLQVDNWNCYLFQFHAFYVEICYYNKRAKDAIILSFDDLDFLDPYLKKIDISELELINSRK
jgi:hypothetical protein